MQQRKRKTCIIICYKYIDYVRGNVLTSSFKQIDNISIFQIKNKKKNLLRYIEVLGCLVWTRLRYGPDIYVLTFRGYEILPFVRLITAGKPLIYDEFINPIEWLVFEHKIFKEKSLPSKCITWFYRLLLKSVSRILTDTKIHADYSANLMRINQKKYLSIPVGADESIFNQSNDASSNEQRNEQNFEIFYYGSMLPLHGLKVVIDTALSLKSIPDIKFRIVGGSKATELQIKTAKKTGANISYQSWVELRNIVKMAKQANVCLGGPFGGTIQANNIITGKTYQFFALGCPTIIGDNDANNGTFVDKINCIIVERNSVQSLREGILWSYKNRKSLHKISENARKTFQNEFSYKAISKLLEGVL